MFSLEDEWRGQFTLALEFYEYFQLFLTLGKVN